MIITLLTGLAMAAPCLDEHFDELDDGPTYETADDGTVSITIPTDDYWGVWHCGRISMRAIEAGPPTWAAAWLHGAPWVGVTALPQYEAQGYIAEAKDDAAGLVPSIVAFLASADKGVGLVELGDGRAYRVRISK